MRNKKCHPITSPPLHLNLFPTHKSRSPPTMPITGACLCGKTTVSLESAHEDQVSPVDRLSFESVNRPFLEQIICHCNDCKRTSGSAFSTNVLAPSKDVTIKGPTKEFGIKADSGNIGGFSAQVVHVISPRVPAVTRIFCGECGCAIAHVSPVFGDSKAIQTGLFPLFARIPVSAESQFCL